MKKLSPSDKELWERVTRTVRPLGQVPMAPSKGQNNLLAVKQQEDRFEPRLDLHGLSIQQAYTRVFEYVTNGALLGYRKLTIISGRSGQINIELPRWMEFHPDVRSVVPINNGGAWQICLRKRDT